MYIVKRVDWDATINLSNKTFSHIHKKESPNRYWEKENELRKLTKWCVAANTLLNCIYNRASYFVKIVYLYLLFIHLKVCCTEKTVSETLTQCLN